MATATFHCSGSYKVPASVASAARVGLAMVKAGYAGGHATGHKRAKQLATCASVDEATINFMRNWFARHGPNAANGGTSYRGYKKFVEAIQSKDPKVQTSKGSWHGAVAWMIWGGDPAYRWIRNLRKDLGANKLSTRMAASRILSSIRATRSKSRSRSKSKSRSKSRSIRRSRSR